MTKRKKATPKLSTYLVAAAILLILTIGKIAAPPELYEFLGLEPPTSTSKLETKSNPGIEDLGKSTFTKEELTNRQKGYIVYENLDNLKRPQGAYALLKKAMINTGTSANRDIRPVGFISGEKPYYHSRGHLIGRQLGGSGDEVKNLATLYQNPVNTPYMTKYENQVRAALEKGLTIFYRVTVEYDGEKVFPKAVVMEAKSLNSTEIDFHVRIYNLPE